MSVLAYLAAHGREIAEALGLLLAAASVVTGLLPESARRARVAGVLVRATEFLSLLTHRDSPGTLKAPCTSACTHPAPPPPDTGDRPAIPPPPPAPGA